MCNPLEIHRAPAEFERRARISQPDRQKPFAQISTINAITDAFQNLAIDAPVEVICAYVERKHGVHVQRGLVQGVRAMVRHPA
jgi:hypothetical protein